MGVLAVIGLYGVSSYSVSRRVHEIGLRIALGATRGSVFTVIYRQSALICSGLAIGLVVAFLAPCGVEAWWCECFRTLDWSTAGLDMRLKFRDPRCGDCTGTADA
jgi:ABC-type lipoprotein release transport system permease subunit